MKKIFTVIVLLLLIAMVTAGTFIFGKSKEEVYGKVTEINGSEVTVELGELNQSQPENIPDKPPEENSDSDSNKPPEMPSGEDSNEEPPEKPDGEDMPNNTPPEKPDDSNGNTSNQPNGTPPEEVPNGENGFKSNGETKTYNLGNVTIKEQNGDEVKDSTIESIKVDSIIKLDIGLNQKVLQVTIINEGGNIPGQDQINQGTSANTISTSETITDKSYESSGDDENALRVS